MRCIKLAVLFFVVGCVLTTLSTPSALATDWYSSDFGGDWDNSFTWKDSAGNSPPGGQPGEGDSAFLVVPYMFNDYPNWYQPVSVYYRSDTNPLLNQVVIEGGNELWQWQYSYGGGTPPIEQLNLRSNVERIGGSGLTFDPPPPEFGGPPSEIFPIGSHMQNAGTNSTGGLFVGGTAGSEGLYRLEGTGALSVGGMEYLGDAGTGRFEQNGGNHWVGTTLFMGYEATGDGTYLMTDGSLTVDGSEVVGASGTGLFDHHVGGTNSTGQLFIGQDATGSGTYILGGLSELNVSGTTTIGNHGQGVFEQSAGTHTAGDLVLGAEAGGDGSYDLRGGTLEVIGNTQIGGSGGGTFSQIGGTHNADRLTLAVQSGSTGAYDIGATGTLNTADTLVVGERGTATFVQDGGTVNVGTVSQQGELRIGDAIGTGDYTLNNGLLNVVGISKIWRGSSFTQTGGEYRGPLLQALTNSTHTMEGGNLYLFQWDMDGNVNQTGGNANVTFNFTLGATGHSTPSEYLLEATGAGPAPHLTAGSAVIGNQSRGVFTQRGADSEATFDSLILGGGFEAGSYNLEDGTLHVSGQEIIGQTSSGTFRQTGGRNEIVGKLIIGDQADGRYRLTASVLDVNGDMFIRRGSLVNDAGANFVQQDLFFGKEFGGTSEYELRNFGLLWVHGNETIGAYEVGHNNFFHYSGVHAVDHDLTIDNDSSYSHFGGSLLVGGDLYMHYGTSYDLDDDAQITVDGSARFYGLDQHGDITVAGDGTFGWGNQQNGETTVAGDGQFNGMIQQNGDIIVHGNASATGHLQEGGNFLVAGALDTGGYTMNDGRLESATYAGNFIQNSGEQIVSGEMIINGSSTIRGGSLTAGNINIDDSKTFTMEGWASVSAAGGILNEGHFNFTGIGSKKTVDASLINSLHATTNISEAYVDFRKSIDNEAARGGRGTISIDRSVVDFRGSFSNYGHYDDCDPWPFGCWDDQRAQVLIEDSFVNFHESFWNDGLVVTLNSTTRFLGGYTGDGAFYTDPSDIYFSNATFLEGGTIQAGPGDRFFVEGDFVNGSLENTLWDTSDASLIFNGVGTQIFYLAGIDMGATALGYEDNFAWGELILGSGVNLTLLDGNELEGAALYIGLLGFEDPRLNIADLLLDSIFSDFNIYYNPMLAGNSYLDGLSFALNGAGFLLPTDGYTPPTEPIPEPSTIILLGCGLVGLVFVVRRRKKNDYC